MVRTGHGKRQKAGQGKRQDRTGQGEAGHLEVELYRPDDIPELFQGVAQVAVRLCEVGVDPNALLENSDAGAKEKKNEKGNVCTNARAGRQKNRNCWWQQRPLQVGGGGCGAITKIVNGNTAVGYNDNDSNNSSR